MNLTPDAQKKAGVVAAFVLLAAGILYYELKDDSPAPVGPVVVTVPGTGAGQIAGTAAGRGTLSAAGVSRPGGVVPAGSTGGAAAKSLGTTSAELDPTLRMGPMLVTEALVYSGSGRNIFSGSSALADIPRPIASARPKLPVVPVYTPPPGPPPPPPIDLKFFGTATSANGQRRAFLLRGEDVFLATEGDIVQRRYRVGTIAANSIVVEDLTNNNRQTLPLLGN